MKKDVDHKRTEDNRSVVAISKDILWTPKDVRWQIAGFQKCQCSKCRQAKVETTATNAWSDGNWSLSRSNRTCRFTSAIYMHFSILEWQFLNTSTYAFASCKHPWEFCNQIWIPTLEKPYLPHIALLLRRPHQDKYVCLLIKWWRKFHFEQMSSHHVANWRKTIVQLSSDPWNSINLIFHSIYILVEHLSGPVTSQLFAAWPVLSRITFPTWRTGEIRKVSLPVGESFEMTSWCDLTSPEIRWNMMEHLEISQTLKL